MYKVLWIDDEHEKNPNFQVLCEMRGIELEVRDNSEDGIRELKKRDLKYDAVILDAKVKTHKDSASNLRGLTASRDFLNRLNGDQFIPYFIYTGQTDYMKQETFEESYGDYYVKVDDDEHLIQDIIIAVTDRPQTLLKRQFPDAFKLFENKFIDPSYEKHLIRILKKLQYKDIEFEDELYFNQLRQILEEAFRRAAEAGILHEKCISDKNSVILRLSSRFMSGLDVNELGIKCKKTHFPKIISNHVSEILDISNIGSHAESEGKEESEENLREYRRILNTTYLLYSLTFKLMDVLIWFDSYIRANNHKELNKSLWVDIITSTEKVASTESDWIQGTVTRVAENGWGTFIPNGSIESISIPPKMIKDYSIKEYQKINVATKPSPNGSKLHIESIRIQS